MKKLLIGLLFALVTTCAMSQSAFQGFYGQVSAGYGTTSPSLESGSGAIIAAGTSYPFTYVIDHKTSSHFVGTATVGYRFKISKKFLLGIGAQFNQFDGNWTTLETTTMGGVKSTDEYAIANSYDFFLSPSYVIDKDKLVTVKVGYNGSRTKNRITGSTNSDDHNAGGYILGLGYKQIIKGGWYGLAHADYLRTAYQTYNDIGVTNGIPYTTTSRLSSHGFNFQVGIGYTIQRKKSITKQKSTN